VQGEHFGRHFIHLPVKTFRNELDAAGRNHEEKLMSAFALWYYSKMKPKSHTSPAPKPQAAMAMVAAVRRVHKRIRVGVLLARQSAVLQALQRGFARNTMRQPNWFSIT
jgi:exopolyphosphatase/pppGpp-phosphohydrolase